MVQFPDGFSKAQELGEETLGNSSLGGGVPIGFNFWVFNFQIPRDWIGIFIATGCVKAHWGAFGKGINFHLIGKEDILWVPFAFYLGPKGGRTRGKEGTEENKKGAGI